MKDFFRPDLKLDQKRWHRAIKVVWFIGFFIIIIICGFVFYLRYDSDLYLPSKEYVGDINDRLTNKVKDIRDILKEGEYLSLEKYKSYERYNIDGLLDFPKGICWCSKSRDSNKLAKLNNQNGYIYYTDSLTNDTTSNYDIVVKNINNPCIIKSDTLYYNSTLLYIYNINYPNKYKITAVWLLQSLGISVLLISLYTLITVLLYYKGLLYIIYGNKKK